MRRWCEIAISNGRDSSHDKIDGGRLAELTCGRWRRWRRHCAALAAALAAAAPRLFLTALNADAPRERPIAGLHRGLKHPIAKVPARLGSRIISSAFKRPREHEHPEPNERGSEEDLHAQLLHGLHVQQALLSTLLIVLTLADEPHRRILLPYRIGREADRARERVREPLCNRLC